MQRLVRCHLHIHKKTATAARSLATRAASEARLKALKRPQLDNTQPRELPVPNVLQQAPEIDGPQVSHLLKPVRAGERISVKLNTTQSKSSSSRTSKSSNPKHSSLLPKNKQIRSVVETISPNDIEFRQEVRKVYRHLLRAATYFPDDFARTYIQNDLHALFRNREKGSTNTEEKQIRRMKLLKRARDGISMIQRATEGEAGPLFNILRDVYGRAGPRRRELLAQLRRTPKSAVNHTHEDLTAALESADIFDKLQPNPAFEALLKSQKQAKLDESPRRKLKRINPDTAIPKENIFGRPLAKKLLAGKTKRFWASVFDKVLPPLPEHEWNRLRDLATGVIKFKGVPPRRIPGLTAAQIEKCEMGPKGKHKGQSLGPSSQIRESKRIPGTNDQIDSTIKTFHVDSSNIMALPAMHVSLGQQIDNKHVLTSSYMRRAWKHIWLLTPLLSYSADKDKWTVKWGARTAYGMGRMSEAGTADLELFAGLLAVPDQSASIGGEVLADEQDDGADDAEDTEDGAIAPKVAGKESSKKSGTKRVVIA